MNKYKEPTHYFICDFEMIPGKSLKFISHSRTLNEAKNHFKKYIDKNDLTAPVKVDWRTVEKRK